MFYANRERGSERKQKKHKIQFYILFLLHTHIPFDTYLMLTKNQSFFVFHLLTNI